MRAIRNTATGELIMWWNKPTEEGYGEPSPQEGETILDIEETDRETFNNDLHRTLTHREIGKVFIDPPANPGQGRNMDVGRHKVVVMGPSREVRP